MHSFNLYTCKPTYLNKYIKMLTISYLISVFFVMQPNTMLSLSDLANKILTNTNYTQFLFIPKLHFQAAQHIDQITCGNNLLYMSRVKCKNDILQNNFRVMTQYRNSMQNDHQCTPGKGQKLKEKEIAQQEHMPRRV